MKTFMTTSLMTALLTGTALLAQTGKAPAPAPAPAAGAASTATPAPAKVKKHHRKAKTTTPDAAPANAAPAKK